MARKATLRGVPEKRREKPAPSGPRPVRPGSAQGNRQPAPPRPAKPPNRPNRKPNRQSGPPAEPDRRVRAAIEQLAVAGAWFGSREVIVHAGVTRQAAHRHLSQLVRDGRLVVTGKARATRYRGLATPIAAAASAVAPAAPFSRRYLRAGLQEDAVHRDVVAGLPALVTSGAASAQALIAYALTEMVNNAIDHSGAAEVLVRAGSEALAGAATFWFEVEDHGVGAFENVRRAFDLPDALAGLQEISKGKRTTQPERHSGEGLFFTSKMADTFELHANGLAWLVDNQRGDQAVGVAAEHAGTLVRFVVARDTHVTPEAVFARYTHDFDFDTSHTVVKLFAHGVRFVSRSEAKRLLDGLERFAHVVLDFAGVEAVGQGFADEIFRVWAGAHPAVELRPENMAVPVAFMVNRARGARPR
jgi:anti-sigma regulatory factor (Ser/Thr protein kinase)